MSLFGCVVVDVCKHVFAPLVGHGFGDSLECLGTFLAATCAISPGTMLRRVDGREYRRQVF